MVYRCTDLHQTLPDHKSPDHKSVASGIIDSFGDDARSNASLMSESPRIGKSHLGVRIRMEKQQ